MSFKLPRDTAVPAAGQPLVFQDGDRKGGEALLAVHDAKVAEIMQWVGLGLDSHHAADEVARHVAVRVSDRAVLLEDVLPEVALLICAPAIVARW